MQPPAPRLAGRTPPRKGGCALDGLLGREVAVAAHILAHLRLLAPCLVIRKEKCVMPQLDNGSFPFTGHAGSLRKTPRSRQGILSQDRTRARLTPCARCNVHATPPHA